MFDLVLSIFIAALTANFLHGVIKATRHRELKQEKERQLRFEKAIKAIQEAETVEEKIFRSHPKNDGKEFHSYSPLGEPDSSIITIQHFFPVLGIRHDRLEHRVFYCSFDMIDEHPVVTALAWNERQKVSGVLALHDENRVEVVMLQHWSPDHVLHVLVGRGRADPDEIEHKIPPR